MKFSHRFENQDSQTGARNCIVSIDGMIDLESVMDVKTYIAPFVQDTTIKGLVINLREVGYLDSSGIGMIVSFYKILQQRQAQIALCEVSPKVDETFKLTQLRDILNIFPNEAEALASLA